MINRVGKFINETKIELGKVSWSTKDELIGSTTVVIVSLALLTIFIYICDVILSRVVNYLIR